ncbi:MAG: (d)CMP kinase [Chromatiales bacterium]
MGRVVTIDGPSGSGKGTVGRLLARRLGWSFLDSGALYRVLGLAAQRAGIPLDGVERLADLARTLDVAFEGEGVLLDGEDVTDAIRSEAAGDAASRVAAVPEVRLALLERQRGFAVAGDLVADGRDMGSVVFPDAPLKIFLTASAEERARRRYKQLKEKGLDVNLQKIMREIRERDERDRTRTVAPLRAPAAAIEVESSDLGIDEVLDRVLGRVREAFPELEV